MVTLITVNDDTAATTSPELILGYETARRGRNVFHEILGGGTAVSLVPADPRSGTLRLYYPLEADAVASVELHSRGETLTLTETDRDSVDMTYALDGAVGYALDEETRDDWVVTVDYRELDA